MSQSLGIYNTLLLSGFYSDVVVCLPVDPATHVQFPAGTGWNILALLQWRPP